MFSILPEPKGSPVTTKSFVPNVLVKKTNKAKSLVKRPEQTIDLKIKANGEAESDDEFTKPPETFDVETWKKVCGRKRKVSKPISTVAPVMNTTNIIDLAPEPEVVNNKLDNQAVCIIKYVFLFFT